MAQQSHSKKKEVTEINKEFGSIRVNDVEQIREDYIDMYVTEIGINNEFAEVKTEDVDFGKLVVEALTSSMVTALFEEVYPVYKRWEDNDPELSLDASLESELGDLDRDDAREYADERAGHDWEKWNDDLWHNHDFRQVIEVQYVGIELTEEVVKND